MTIKCDEGAERSEQTNLLVCKRANQSIGLYASNKMKIYNDELHAENSAGNKYTGGSG